MKRSIIPLIFSLVIVVICDSPSTISIQGKIRDFANCDSGLPQRHPDFNCFLVASPGLVEEQIGSDRKPVLNLNSNYQGVITSEDTFNQWFRDVPGVNIPIDYTLVLTKNDETGNYEFHSGSFFPIDNQGYGNEFYGHNFGFCFELHTLFTYQSGEVFNFEGDDDVWIFINGLLAVDLGGVHGPQSYSLNVDSLDLVVGKTYPIDGFFCERHTSGSDFIFTTGLELFPCGKVDSDDDSIFDDCDMCPSGPLSIALDIDKTGNLVNFEVTTSGKYVGDNYEITIDFGDGHTDSGHENFSHIYEPGAYLVTASMITTDLGCISPTVTSSVVVGSPHSPCRTGKVKNGGKKKRKI